MQGKAVTKTAPGVLDHPGAGRPGTTDSRPARDGRESCLGRKDSAFAHTEDGVSSLTGRWRQAKRSQLTRLLSGLRELFAHGSPGSASQRGAEQRAPQEQGSPLGPPLWSPAPGSGPWADRAQRPRPWGAGKTRVPCYGGSFWVNVTGLLPPPRSVLFTCAFPVLARAACPHKTSHQGHSWVSQMRPAGK